MMYKMDTSHAHRNLSCSLASVLPVPRAGQQIEMPRAFAYIRMTSTRPTLLRAESHTLNRGLPSRGHHDVVELLRPPMGFDHFVQLLRVTSNVTNKLDFKKWIP